MNSSHEVSPLITAIKIRLTRQDTIKTYYDHKLSLLKLTHLSPQDITDLLTDGLPESYRNLLRTSNITTPNQWLYICSLIETDMNKRNMLYPTKFTDQQQHILSSTVASNQQFKGYTRNSSVLRSPPQCRICQRLSKQEYHWHSECPNKCKQTTSAITKTNPESALAKNQPKRSTQFQASLFH